MDKENIVYMQSGLSFSHKEQRKMDETGEHHGQQISQTQKDKYHVSSHIWNLEKRKKKLENRRKIIWEGEVSQWEE
jgi:hypothetical protein